MGHFFNVAMCFFAMSERRRIAGPLDRLCHWLGLEPRDFEWTGHGRIPMAHHWKPPLETTAISYCQNSPIVYNKMEKKHIVL